MKHLLLVGLIFLFGACVSIPELPPQPKALVDYKAPKWVLVGGGAFTDVKVKLFMVLVQQLALETFRYNVR